MIKQVLIKYFCDSNCKRCCGSCKFYRANKQEVLKKVNEEYSVSEIYKENSALATAEILNKKYNTTFFNNINIMKIIRESGGELRTLKEATNLPSTRKKAENTFVEKYGAVNPLSKGTTAFEKKSKTVKEKYGVDNVFQNEEIKKKIVQTTFERFGCYSQAAPEVHQKTLKTMIEKYGCWALNTEKARKKCLQSQLGNRNWISKPDIKIQNLLKEMGIDFEVEKSFYDKETKKWKIADIVVGNIDFEIQGDYWHANPEIYKSSDIMYHNITAEEIWKRDLEKKIFLKEKFGIEVIYLWERDINSNINKIKEIITEALNAQ
jgi:galactitol-specific phosphotransferase system IIB component